VLAIKARKRTLGETHLSFSLDTTPSPCWCPVPCPTLRPVPLVRRGWCRRLGALHCCSLHFVALFFSLGYFTVGSSAGRSPFWSCTSSRVSSLSQLVCLSIPPALASVLFFSHPHFGVSHAPALSPVSPLVCSIPAALAFPLRLLLGVRPFNVYGPFLSICFCRGAVCSSGSISMCSGCILSVVELPGTNGGQHSAVHDCLLHRSPLQHPHY